MLFESRRIAPQDSAQRFEFASGPPSDFFDVVASAFEQGRTVDNPLARRRTLEEAYDTRIDAVFRATGQRMDNPARMAQPGIPEADGVEQDFETFRLSRQQRFRAHDPYQAFDEHLARLAEQHPDHRGVIQPERSPRLDAQERARRADEKAQDVLARYDGPAGTGTLGALIGGAGAGFTDPANLMAMAIGPMGTVGAGARALAWNALKAGAANAGVEAGFQPLIASWRKEAGLDYDISHFAMNVGAAGALGFGLDAGLRGAVRGVQRYRGLVPRTDAGGGFVGWQTPEQALEAAALKSKIDDVMNSAGGVPGAMRRLAAALGRDGDPEIMKAIDRFEMEVATAPRHPDLDPDDSDARFVQAVRSVLDEREPPPADAAPQPRERDVEADAVGAPERAEARRMIDEGGSDPIELAQALRAYPDLAAGASFASEPMQVARALSRLSDEAFGRVLDGGADPRHAALVGQLEPDPLRHASTLEALTRAQPESLEEARHLIGDLTPPAPRGALDGRIGGLDDPTGPEAKAQVEVLESLLGDRLKQARTRIETPDGKPDEIDLMLSRSLAEADRLETLHDLLEACKL